MKRRSLLGAVLCGLLLASGMAQGNDAARRAERPYRIAHVMSYDATMAWSAGQFAAFKETFSEVPVEYRVFELDVLRNRSEAHAVRAGAAARAAIAQWKPDLIYLSDDAAQKHVGAHYVNAGIPVVFSGVNADPSEYGYRGSANVAGILEHEHFPESVRLLQALAPGARRIAAIFDPSPHWSSLRERMKAALAAMPDVEVVAWDVVATWPEYQRKMAEYPSRADAVALIGYFDFSASGGPSHPEIMRWTAENAALPDLGLWGLRVRAGTLAAVSVSEREQGLAAGRLARSILVDGKAPAALGIHATKRGLSMISLARARKLGLKPTTSVLLSAEIVEKFDWDRP